jgi:hypothetical protein
MSAHRPPIAAILAVPVAVAVILTLFAWPAARLEPRDLPVGVAGTPAAADAVEQRLERQAGAFDVRRYSDERAARKAIEDREVYGAFVATPAGPKVLTASAASPTVAQLLGRAASERGAAEPVPVQDVASAPPAGAGLAASVLPLVLAGILTGGVAVALGSGFGRRAAVVTVGSVLSGLAATAIVQSWLGVVEGEWAANAAALSLTVMAIAAVVAGFEALLGKAGLGLAALTMILIGNPFSGVGTAPELLPQPVGGLGQLLPPGAGGNLLRSTGFFDGAGAGGYVAVLVAWVLIGLAAMAAASLRARASTAQAADSSRRRLAW